MTVPPFDANPADLRVDHSTFGGATRLADRIRRIWKKYGHAVKVEVIQACGAESHHVVFGVRTDLVGGLPKAKGRN